MSVQSDSALEAFDRLRVWEVRDWGDSIHFPLLPRFQSTAASLGPEERIKLEMTCAYDNMELLKAVLVDPHASKICSLVWQYDGKEDVTSVIPLLISNCPKLASLQADFNHHLAVDFASSVLEHPGNKIKVLEMPRSTRGDLPRFFAALEQSQVSALSVPSNGFTDFAQGLYNYLARDLLVRLTVNMNFRQVPSEMIMSLATCARLVELRLTTGTFHQPTTLTHLPKSITTLVLYFCSFVNGFDWSFLIDSNLRELDLHSVQEVDGSQLGSALAVHLRAKGLDRLRLGSVDFANDTLAAIGLEIGRVKRLEIGRVNDASMELISLVLQSPNSEMKELKLEYRWNTMSSIKNHLVPALRHSNCSLDKLSLQAFQAHEELAKTVNITFRSRRALFALLQGQRVRKQYCPLRRLPVELLRLVGMVLV